MIERLVLRDFQRHEKLTLDLDPGMNCIVGPSDSGKSSVVRALRWACLNQPGGDSFVRHGGGAAEVRLAVDGRKIRRRRGKGVHNTYALDGSDFRAFGSGVPDEIASLLNVSDINFQRQHEPLFWLTLTAGEAAKRLNEIVSLETIDRATVAIASRCRGLKEREDQVRDRMAQAEQGLQELGWLPEALAAWEKLEALEARRDEASLDYADRELVLRRAEEAQRLLHGLEGAVDGAGAWVAAGDRLTELERERGRVAALADRVEAQMKRLVAAESARAEAEDAFERDFKNCPLCGNRWKKPS